MESSMVVVLGVIKPDGTLELAEKLVLPAGPAQVTVVPVLELPGDDPFWQRMQANLGRPTGSWPRAAQRRTGRSGKASRAAGMGGTNRPSGTHSGRSKGCREIGEPRNMIVCMDADCIIYFVERHSSWAPRITARLAAFRSVGDQIGFSDLARTGVRYVVNNTASGAISTLVTDMPAARTSASAEPSAPSRESATRWKWICPALPRAASVPSWQILYRLSALASLGLSVNTSVNSCVFMLSLPS